jgi:hypothetical protein
MVGKMAGVSLASLKISAELDPGGYQRGADAVAAANQKMVDSGKKVADGVEQTERKLGTASSGFERLQRSLDPAYASSLKFEAGQRNIQAALDKGVISSQRASDLIDKLRDRYAATNDNLKTHVTAVDQASDSHGRFSVQAQAAFHSVRSMAEGIALGTPPVTVLTQQLNHLSFAATGSGGLVGALKELATAAGSVLLNPIGLATAGVVAFGAALAVVVTRASNNEAAMRTFSVALGPLDTGSQKAATSLQEAARQLRDMGVAASTANTTIAELARNPLLKPEAAGQITSIGANVGARLGLTPEAGVKTFSDAIAGGTDSIIKLGVQLRALDADEVANILTMQRHGKGAEAMARAVDLIQQSTDGAREKSLSPFQKSIEGVRTAWDQMLTSFANTSSIQSAMDAIAAMFRGIAAVTSGTVPPPAGGAASSTGSLGTSDIGPVTLSGTAQNGFSGVADRKNDASSTTRTFATSDEWRAAIDRGEKFDNFSITEKRIALPGVAGMPQSLKEISGSNVRAEDAEKLGQINNDLARQREEITKLTPEWQKFGSAQTAGVAAEQARTKVLEEGGTAEQAASAAAVARNRAIAETTASLGKEAQVQKETTDGVLAEAKAFSVDAVSGYKAAADAAAKLLVTQEPLKDFETERQRLLNESAAAAINAAAKALPGLDDQTAANNRLAEAAKGGTAAEHEAELQNKVVTSTQDALNKAMATENTELIDHAKNLTDDTAARIKANDASKNAVDIRKGINTNNDAIEQMRLEVSLQGDVTGEINRQVGILRTIQDLKRKNEPLDSQAAKDAIASADAYGRASTALADAQRNQQALDDGVRKIADTVDSELVKGIEDAFNGKKVDDWGAKVKSWLSKLEAQLLDMALIRPALGTPLGFGGWGSFPTEQETTS